MKSMDASIAIPTIVSGTIVIALLFSFLVLREHISWSQVLGSCLILIGIFFLFMQRPGSA
ncbi:MAG: EamA family transporter [Boseongicola sp. SB0673_bin_14]|nr:EamA family transporter [Boseongicola sp. SB0673_bin_14]